MKILNGDELQTQGQTIFLYGTPGAGKTTALGALPGKTLIIDADRGTNVLQGNKNIHVVRLDEDLADLPRVCEMLEKECGYNNIAIDSLSELERGMLTVLGRTGKGDGAPELRHFLLVQYKMADYVRRLRALGKNLILTAWEIQKEIIAPTGEKHTRAQPALGEKSADTIAGLSDVVGRVAIHPKSGERYIQLKATTSVVAKDRLARRDFCKVEELI